MLIPLLRPEKPSYYLEHSLIYLVEVRELESPTNSYTHSLRVHYKQPGSTPNYMSWQCTEKSVYEFAENIYEACRFATIEEANLGVK